MTTKYVVTKESVKRKMRNKTIKETYLRKWANLEIKNTAEEVA